MSAGWQLIANSYGGLHVGHGYTATEAKADARERIAETCAGGESPRVEPAAEKR